MIHETQPESIFDEFTLPCQATQDTVWVSDPADPTVYKTGPIRRGDTIWVHHELFGSGPIWQPARLKGSRLGFVQPHHFDQKVDSPNLEHSVSL